MGRAGQLLALGRPLRRGNGPCNPRAPGQLPASPHPCRAHPGRASHTRVSPAREGACSAATASAAIESAAAGILVTIAHLLSPRWSRSVYCRVAGHPCLEQNVPAHAWPSSLQPHPPGPVEMPPPARLSPASSAAAWWQRRLISMVTRFRIQRWPSPQPGPAGPLSSSVGSRASCASDSPAGAPHMIKPGETSAFQSLFQPGWGTTSVELTGTAQARSNLGRAHAGCVALLGWVFFR